MICGLGNALVDALVRIPDDGVLEQLRLRRGTMHLVDDARWQQAFDAVEPHGVAFSPGGSCANSMVTAAALGAEADLCANVGTDRFGEIYAAGAAELLGTHHVRQGDEGPTGKCLSLISAADAERTMLTDLGCAMELPAEALFRDSLRRADLFHCTGYLFTGGPIGAVADEALAVARRHKVRVSFDVADPWVIEAHRDRLAPVVESAHVVFLNREEAQLWGDTEDPVAAAEALARRVPIVALKLGAQGSVVLWDGRRHEVRATRVEAVDTTGAGDAYAGGFLYGLDRGLEPSRCAEIASRIGAATVAQVGAVVRDPAQARAAIEG